MKDPSFEEIVCDKDVGSVGVSVGEVTLNNYLPLNWMIYKVR